MNVLGRLLMLLPLALLAALAFTPLAAVAMGGVGATPMTLGPCAHADAHAGPRGKVAPTACAAADCSVAAYVTPPSIRAGRSHAVAAVAYRSAPRPLAGLDAAPEIGPPKRAA